MSTSTILEPQLPPTLRKRTKALQLPYESESPGSQLPSPLSSVEDEVPDVLETNGQPAFVASPPNSRRRRSSAPGPGSRRTKSQSIASTEKTEDTQWSDIPLAVALIPPLGSFFNSGDFLRDLILFILLFYYLHQLIKLPWELYLASRPRRRRVARTDVKPDEQRLHEFASSELRTAEFCYLALAVFAPLLGAALLRYVGTVLTGRDYISWFSTGVYVLVTGIRPWRHLGQRLRERTEELQGIVHNAMRTDDMEVRVRKLEAELIALRDATATREDMVVLDDALNEVRATIKRQLRTAESERHVVEERFKLLEQTMEVVHAVPKMWTLPAPGFLSDWMRPQSMTLSRAPLAGSQKNASRTQYRPRLAPVHEEDIGTAGKRQRRLQANVYPLAVSWLEMALAPFRVGRKMVWLILDLLERKLV